MAWIGSLISVLGGAATGIYGNKQQEKSAERAANKSKSGTRQAMNMIRPYSETGSRALYGLASLMGLEGYRTNEEQAYTDFLKTKPSAPVMGKRYDGSSNWMLGGAQRGILGDNLADLSSPNSIQGNLLVPGAGSAITRSVWGREDDKEEASRAAARRHYKKDMAKYEADMAAWETKRAEMEASKNKSLESYDNLASLRSRPGYQFRYQTGLDTTKNALAARSGYLGGRALKELSDYGQNFATGEFDKEFQRLGSMAGAGYNANVALGNLARNKANTTADLYNLQGTLANQDAQTINNALQAGVRNYYQNQSYQNAQNPSSFQNQASEVYRTPTGVSSTTPDVFSA